MLSDEIHAPLTLPGARFTPYLTVSDAARERGIAVTSASKAFNVAGLMCAQIVTASDTAADRAERIAGTTRHAGHYGVLAAVAAFSDPRSSAWLDRAIELLDSNRTLLAELLAEQLPEARWVPPEAGYLAWIDLSAYGLGPDPAPALLEHGRIAVSPGPQFGAGGDGYVRLNVATSPKLVREAVARIATAIGGPRAPAARSRARGTGAVHGPVDRMLLPYLERLCASIPGEPLTPARRPHPYRQQRPRRLLADAGRADRRARRDRRARSHLPDARARRLPARQRRRDRCGAGFRRPVLAPSAGSTRARRRPIRCERPSAASTPVPPGIKLHPRAEGFALSEPGVERLFALAAERRVPILVHAGRGIPALGRDAVRLAEAHPDARLILAHAGISDLAWLQALVEPGSNLFFDTAWWNPADLIALFASVPSSQILWASDSPYTTPLAALVWHGRCAIQAGIEQGAFRAIAGLQAERVLTGEEIVALGAPAGESGALDPMLERVYTHLVSAFGATNAGGDPAEKLDLARLSCQVPEDYPEAELLHELEALIGDVIAEHLPVISDGEHRFGALEQALVSLLIIARTPAAGAAGRCPDAGPAQSSRTPPSAVRVQCGLWAISHGWPSGSMKRPLYPPQNVSAGSRAISAPAARASSIAASTSAGEPRLSASVVPPQPPGSATPLSSASRARSQSARTMSPAWKKTTSSSAAAPVVQPSAS